MFSGYKIVKALKDKQLSPDNLTQHMRLLAVEYLYLETNTSSMAMAELFDVNPSTVTRDLHTLEEINAKYSSFEPGDIGKILKRLIFKAKMIQGRALKKENLELAWKIENDLVEKLGRIGYIPYKNEVIKFHAGDVIEDGGRKSVLKVENGAGLSAEEQTEIDLILARAKSRANHEESGSLVS